MFPYDVAQPPAARARPSPVGVIPSRYLKGGIRFFPSVSGLGRGLPWVVYWFIPERRDALRGPSG